MGLIANIMADNFFALAVQSFLYRQLHNMVLNYFSKQKKTIVSLFLTNFIFFNIF